MKHEERVEDLLALADEQLAAVPPDLAGAIDVLQRCMYQARRDPRPTLRLAEAYRWLTPDHDQGNEARNAAIAFALRAVWLAPQDADAHLVLAKAFHRQHWFRLAIEHLQLSWELEARAETAFWMGWMFSEIGELDQDLVWLQRARDLEPALHGLSAEFGYGYRVLQLDSEAESALRMAIEENLEDDYPLVNLILLLVAQDRYADAIALGRAVSGDASAPVGVIGAAALAYWLSGDRSAAAPLLERLVAINPAEIVGTWGTHAADLLAEIRWHEGNRLEARELIDMSIAGYDLRLRRASEGWGFRFDRARLAALQGDTERALGWMEDAIEYGWNDVLFARRDPMLTALGNATRFRAMLAAVDQRVSDMRQRHLVVQRP